MKALVFCILIPCAAQQPRVPDLDAQRSAMKKLEFLVGNWTGEDPIFRAEPVVLTQTEEAQYKLDGLVLLIEGVGLTQALGVVSYDDESGKHHMRVP